MKGKGIKVFGVIMSLLLVLSFAATFMVSSTSVVSAGTQKWTQISIPDTDDMQLAPGTDVGAIAVSPDGETLFAAVYMWDNTWLTDLTDDTWYVFKSVDGGYTWKNTDFVDDGTPVVDIKISPDWVDSGIVVVATEFDAYVSAKRGNEFHEMNFPALEPITSMDVTLDEDGDPTYMVGTAGVTGEVYIQLPFTGWTAQNVQWVDAANPLTWYVFTRGVLDVAFSPNYAEDGVTYAVVGGNSSLMGEPDGTHLRAQTDIGTNNWGQSINDAHFADEQEGDNILADRACIAFADDYNSAPAVFVGLSAYVDMGQLEPRGDAFRVDIVSGAIGTSAVDDLNIRGENTRTNVFSLAVSGASTSAFILAGLRDLSNFGSMTSWQGTIHYSANGGESWLQSYKPPSGLIDDPSFVYTMGHPGAWVIMAPDFEDSGVAYCGTGTDPLFDDNFGFSGFYASQTPQGEGTTGTTYNGRGLLDHTILEITDVVPSPEYDVDSTLFMITADAPPPLSNQNQLWESVDGGKTWDEILSMTLMIPLPGVKINKVEIPSTFPSLETSIFVNGPDDAALFLDSNMIVRSTDEGNLWATTLRGPFVDGDIQMIGAWKVIDQKTLIVASGEKVWKTTDLGFHWEEEEGANITGDVIDLQLWNDTTVIVGTDAGDVFICQNWETDFSFTQVDSGPGAAGDDVRVAFDANYDDNGIIYAGVDSVGGLTGGIWRIDANGGDEWEQIVEDVTIQFTANDEFNGLPITVTQTAGDIYSITCDGNGILWAIAHVDYATTGNYTAPFINLPVREVNPTAPIDDIDPEYVLTGLTSDLRTDLETAPTQTYVFAIGGAGNTELWAYIDTLIKPTLISPADGATAAGTILQGNAMALLSLRWEEMPKATTYEYQVAYDTGFGSIAVTDDTVDATQATIQLYLGEQYYWRVRAVSPIVSQWSDSWTFTTPLGPASSKPVVTYPGASDSHNDIPLTPTLTWTSAVECTGYELMVAKNCDWSSPIVNLTGSSALGTDTCYSITQALQQGTNYCWKVRAINEDTDTASPWSDTGTFTTIVVEVEEEEGTPIWVWVVIALSAVLLVGVVVLIIRTRRPV